MLPDDEQKHPSGNGNPPASEGNDRLENSTDPERRKRVRVKVRKKIRIKKKPSATKSLRKIAERVFWTLIVAGFIASLIIMIIQLDIRDERLKQRRTVSPGKTR